MVDGLIVECARLLYVMNESHDTSFHRKLLSLGATAREKADGEGKVAL
jgi:hypothetical protein